MLIRAIARTSLKIVWIMILLHFPIDCNKVFSVIMSCLFYHNTFSLIAPITRIRYSFLFLTPCLVNVLHVPVSSAHSSGFKRDFGFLIVNL